MLAAIAVGLPTAMTQTRTATYFYDRLAHAVIHISGFGHFKARTVVFTVVWAAFATFAAEVLRSAGR